jgi:hypothetical protein
MNTLIFIFAAAILLVVAAPAAQAQSSFSQVNPNSTFDNNMTVENLSKGFTSLEKNITSASENMNKTVTVQDCTKMREMYPSSHNVTINNPLFGKINFNPLDVGLKACKEAGK